jgi:hypothetical protein
MRKKRAGSGLSGRILLKLGGNVEHVVARLSTVSHFSNNRLLSSNGSFYSGGLHSSFAVGFFVYRYQHSLFPIAGFETNSLALQMFNNVLRTVMPNTRVCKRLQLFAFVLLEFL